MIPYIRLRNCVDRLLADAARNETIDPSNIIPKVALKMIGTEANILITERDSNEPDLYHGLFDLGLGFAKIGAFSLREIYGLASNEHMIITVEPIYTDHTLDYYRQCSEAEACHWNPNKTRLQ
ncbi:DUF2958 domain-containing protein [Bartonella sp. LJL80]